MRGLFVISLVIIALTETLGQKANPFLGTWIKKESEPDNLFEDPFSDNRFLKYEFRENGIVFRSNSYLERGVPSKYRIADDKKFSLDYTFYTVISFAGSDLSISDDQGVVLHLVRISGPAVRIEFKETESNVLHKADSEVHPVLNSNIDLYNYFFSLNEVMDVLARKFDLNEAISMLNYNVGPVSDDISVTVNFIVDRRGQVKDVKVLESTHPKKNSEYIAKIEGMSGFWNPAVYNNELVDSDLTLTFKKIGTKTIEKLNSADNLFNKGQRQFENGEIEKSVETFTKALTFNPLNQRCLLWRAKAYLELKDNVKACDDLVKLKNPGEAAKKLMTENCK